MKCIIKKPSTFTKKPQSIVYPVIMCVRFASISTFAIIITNNTYWNVQVLEVKVV